jgi:hypothetical protein
MKIKLEFILPDIKAANQACEQMLLARVDDKYIHFLAKPDTDLGKLKSATDIEKTNIIHEGERGVLIGAGLGLLAGLYVLLVPPWLTNSPLWFTNSPWFVILAITTVIGAISVAIGSALLGVNLFNTDLNRFKSKIDKGGILMIVSVPFYRAQEIRSIMNKPLLKIT